MTDRRTILDLVAIEAEPGETDECADAVLAASRAMLGMVATAVAPALEHITLAQLRALTLLAGTGPARIGEIARRLGVHQSTFTRTVDRMVEAGIVDRYENPDNRREVIVRATETGLAHIRDVTERRRREALRILAGLDAPQREAVRLGLQVFARAAGEPAPEALAVLGG